MLRSTQVLVAYPRILSLERLWRHSRSVDVRVIDWGREVDGFQASDPDTLRAELAPIYRHLPGTGALVRLLGVEEMWLPLGIGRIRWEVALDNEGGALSFLERRQ